MRSSFLCSFSSAFGKLLSRPLMILIIMGWLSKFGITSEMDKCGHLRSKLRLRLFAWTHIHRYHIAALIVLFPTAFSIIS
jgi:hypothetical protein